ncbi:glycosyltransferase [Rossellomorea aquimaris]|uniref:glycosyltransferase n=1 Tax=Rossellomorea aquimaris TaxID=189382 RepID=UPI001CD52594|nr:glycosyltransferase [Rossellomorea aquimaris]MCA1058711.1 glycosyltransferase [Rossellomorea aquimaris]
MMAMDNKGIISTHRRLAVIDTDFPWKQSGFRYWEFIEILKQRPDTIFFATNVRREEFPVPVYPFEAFEEMAKQSGITDVYCVFLNLAGSLLGNTTLPSGLSILGSNPSWTISSFLNEKGIKLHTTLYPGGGLSPDVSPLFLKQVKEGCTCIFTNIQEVLDEIPTSIFTPVAINTDFYSYNKKPAKDKIIITFAAHRGVRKGFPLLANVFNELDDCFYLNIIGDWQNHLHLLKNENYSYYGLLPPEGMKKIYQHTHLFIYTGTQDRFIIDGFPVTAAVDAMSTGCLLVSTNQRNDRLTLEDGVDYLEVEPMTYSIINALNWVKEHFELAMKIGQRGSDSIRRQYDCKKIVKKKLHHIFQS